AAGRKCIARVQQRGRLGVDPGDRHHARALHESAAGGVYEDPATGAAAAALAGHLRDSGWLRAGAIEILQGFDMGVPARLRAEYGPEPGSSVRVAGTAHALARQPALID
ncbi:PhzF family phenazine biosynthesis protein, partial [Bordetella pertussis]|uniref:PhzF family phenazine biosynthesis protein n=1 Tax=Bordetella pertussis TaxID=520 RepID=UPI003877E5B1